MKNIFIELQIIQRKPFNTLKTNIYVLLAKLHPLQIRFLLREATLVLNSSDLPWCLKIPTDASVFRLTIILKVFHDDKGLPFQYLTASVLDAVSFRGVQYASN